MKEKIISIGNQYDFAKRLELYIASKLTFTLDLGSHTQTIYYKDKIYMYSLSLMSTNTFILYNKIKSDIEAQKDFVLNKVRGNNYESTSGRYYSVRYAQVPFSAGYVIGVDLNDCYSTILFRERIISEETYKCLLKAKKIDRLVAVGMLAGGKNRHYYTNGILDDLEVIESEFVEVFFYLVNKTNKIMSVIEDLFPKKWLFTWVDGIYFKQITPDICEIKKAETWLKAKLMYDFGMNCKFEQCINFNFQRKGVNLLMDFDKYNEKKGRYEHKEYNIPDPNMIQNIRKMNLENLIK